MRGLLGEDVLFGSDIYFVFLCVKNTCHFYSDNFSDVLNTIYTQFSAVNHASQFYLLLHIIES